jgi:hypothetical protein
MHQLSGPNQSAVLTPDYQCCSAGAAVGPEIGPAGDCAGGGGVAALPRRLAGVLDVDEKAAAVRRHGYTCNFAALLAPFHYMAEDVTRTRVHIIRPGLSISGGCVG